MPRGKAPHKPQLVKQCGAATNAARMPNHARMARPDDDFARRWMAAVMTRRDTRSKEHRS